LRQRYVKNSRTGSKLFLEHRKRDRLAHRGTEAANGVAAGFGGSAGLGEPVKWADIHRWTIRATKSPILSGEGGRDTAGRSASDKRRNCPRIVRDCRTFRPDGRLCCGAGGGWQ